ncbi:Sec-independent protein translocase protein TatB [Shewanella inventionis]|uniref:Sec-independent protein translocase protein TatB n=1 Tax=Shewanella inventionis TaxID=1738770 RepID=A0ABQ1JPV6_9GAMM|nr:Sec-independent protein translocase protein TatB [Shewanella inventionis]MCL1159091.1 Sec-independent protein translocase protein TatB [Shewanella inventionis]UAL43217.1 Sec-independent protein translocase protein TatB [Shewanella inventionis]GGB71274.1 Sec-independent protein translocase protein TatB [Shewanella inventionis]
MFDGIGFMELLLIGILGLVVLGPERLPVAVRSVTGWIRAIKRMANSVKDELEQELKIEQLHSDLKKAESKGLANLSPELKESIEQLKQAAESVNRPYKVEDVSPVASTSETPSTSSNKEAQPVDTTSENSSPPKSNG